MSGIEEPVVAYKVFSVGERGGLYPYSETGRVLMARPYNKRGWNVAPVGGFLVLRTTVGLGDLEQQDTWQETELYEVECTGAVKLPKRRLRSYIVPGDLASEDAAHIWGHPYSKRTKTGKFGLREWPFGTVAFRKIRIVRRLEW